MACLAGLLKQGSHLPPLSSLSSCSVQHICPVRTELSCSQSQTRQGAHVRHHADLCCSNMPSVGMVFSPTSLHVFLWFVSFLPLVTKSDKKIKVFWSCLFFNRDTSVSKTLRKLGLKAQNSPTAAEMNCDS